MGHVLQEWVRVAVSKAPALVRILVEVDYGADVKSWPSLQVPFIEFDASWLYEHSRISYALLFCARVREKTWLLKSAIGYVKCSLSQSYPGNGDVIEGHLRWEVHLTIW